MVLEVNKKDLWHLIMGCHVVLGDEDKLLKGMGKWRNGNWGLEWIWNRQYNINFLKEEELLNLYKYLKKNEE